MLPPCRSGSAADIGPRGPMSSALGLGPYEISLACCPAHGVAAPEPIRRTSGTSARTRRSSGSCRTSRPPTPSSRRWCGRSTTCTRRCSGSRATARASRSGPTTARPPDGSAPPTRHARARHRGGVARARAARASCSCTASRSTASRRGRTPTATGCPTASTSPLDVAPVGDLLERHRERGIELRVLADLRAAARRGDRVRLPVLDVPDGANSQSCSGRSVGNRMTSRIDVVSVSSITRRSMPMPRPAVGGSPYSRARR